MIKLPTVPAKFSMPATIAPEILSVTGTCVTGYFDGEKTKQIEITKRLNISANKEVNLAQIQSDTKIKEQELNAIYKMKKKALKGAVQITAMSIEKGNKEMQDRGVELIAIVLNK